MKLHQLDLNLLLALDALISLRSVTRAAEKLFVSQPAMSHSLNRLRDFFNDPLLVRTPQGMQPTERALYLQRGVHQVLSLLENHLNQPEAFDPRTSQRRFTISTTDYVECVLIPPLVQRLAEEAPGIHLDIQILREEIPESALANGEIDLLLGFDEYMAIPGYLCRETWLTEPLSGLVSQQHARVGDTLTLAQSIELPHVFHSPLGHRGSPLDDYLAERGLQRRISVQSQSYMSAAAIVSHTDHLFILPQRVAAMMAGFWPLRMVELPQDFPVYHLNCVWHPVQDKQPGLCWLRDLMRQLIQQPTPAAFHGAS
ncbi:LysR family transcriptional regulator [Paludibacterium sp. B53371]|uniref:LysR family transcriptional regulator n=1 Tax=Paludibacterium sp. B53371 TaxID=2806263 RepID=UPI001C057518|nr:LysR family transcriptional regulator [Paludibacterium sp. B53371]